MNIIVRPYGSSFCYCRPDTTWERENRDFYVPEGIDQVHWSPVVFVRISKAGKCIGKKFAERYYDALNFGVLLYCRHEAGQLAFSSCFDHSSILPTPMYNTVVLENHDNTFRLWRKGEDAFSCTVGQVKNEIEDAICQASKTTSLRTGDYLAVEFAELEVLAERSEEEALIRAEFCSNELFELKMIF